MCSIKSKYLHMSVLRIASVLKMPHRYGTGIITFQKLETLTNNLVYVAAWYIAGRGNSLNRALLGPMLQHYWCITHAVIHLASVCLWSDITILKTLHNTTMYICTTHCCPIAIVLLCMLPLLCSTMQTGRVDSKLLECWSNAMRPWNQYICCCA
jgi:hypothetical protein